MLSVREGVLDARSALLQKPQQLGRLLAVATIRDALGELLHDSPTESTDRQQTAEQHHSVDALPALACPVIVFEIQPKGELIESQSRPCAVRQRRDARRPR